MIFSIDSFRLTFAEAGKFVMSKDGFAHCKTVPYIIIAQPVEGHYDIACRDGLSTLIRAGEAFLTSPGEPLSIVHHCDPETQRMVILYAHFNFLVFDAIQIADLYELPLRVERPWAEKFAGVIESMLLVRSSPNPKSLRSLARVSELAFSLLIHLSDFLEGRGILPSLTPGVERLLPAIEYARRHLDRGFEVADLAKKASLSVPRFHAEFKRLMGESPLGYVRKIRLAKALDMLRSGGASMDEIARTTGFCNQFHFSREFKKCYGMPPTAFREKNAGWLSESP